jgi:hypothetical protein
LVIDTPPVTSTMARYEITGCPSAAAPAASF